MEALLYFVFWAGLIFLMMRFGCGAHVMGHGRGAGDERQDPDSEAPELRWVPPEKDVDPVCGKTIETGKARSTVFDGSVYYFCSRECREQFEAAPQLYVPRAGQSPEQQEASHG
jgi:YHS domain-containing protein